MISRQSKYILYVVLAISFLAWLFFAIVAQRTIENSQDQLELFERNLIYSEVQRRADYLDKEMAAVKLFIEINKNDDDFEDKLYQLSTSVLDNNPEVVNFSLAVDGIQTYVYPLEGNEGVLGYNLLTDSREDVIEDIQEAIDTNKPIISGPYPMRTNPDKSIVVFRVPIYEDGEFYALLNMVIETDKLFGLSEGLGISAYNISIAKLDGTILYGEGTDIVHQKNIQVGPYEWGINYRYKEEYLNDKTKFARMLDIIFFSSLGIVTSVSIFFIRKTSLLTVRVEDLIYYDELTGLPNRRLLEHDLQKRHSKLLTICFLDVDNFKYLNDSYGHYYGDQFLLETAKKFMLVNGDCYRWGGDEFILVFESLDKAYIERQINLLYESLKEPLVIDDKTFQVSVSMGVYINVDEQERLEHCIELADMAMYSAKNKGKNTYEFYDENHSYYMRKLFRFDQLTKTMDVEKVADVYFQPRFSFADNSIVGLEALFRLVDQGEATLPYGLIEAAENNGTIVDIDKFVLNKVLEYQDAFRNNGIDVSIAVNVSGVTLKKGFIQYVDKMIKENKMDPTKIEIEITEGVSMYNYSDLPKLTTELKDRGFKILLDDFGKQYSGLDNLSRIQVDALKIDRGFVEDIRNPATYKIIKAIISMGKSLNSEIIAEGIETIEQYNQLNELKCDSFQGFLFERAIDKNVLIERYGKKTE